MTGLNSHLPLQLAFGDLLLELADPLPLGVEHRDAGADQGQRRARTAPPQKLAQNGRELADDGVEGGLALLQVGGGLGRGQVVHEHEAGREMRVLASRLAEQLAQRADEHLAPRFGKLVNGALRPAAFLLALDGEDPAIAFEHFDGVVERSKVQADELIVVAFAHPRRHLVRVHRLLVEQLQHRQRQRGEGGVRAELLGHIPDGVYGKGYIRPSTQSATGANLDAFEELVVRLQRRVYEVSGAGYVASNAFSYQATSQ